MLLININCHDIDLKLYSDIMAWCCFDHQSTQGCLDTLYKLGCEDKTILDLGCGSGILSIYANKLGAKSVDSMDINPAAIGLTYINSQLNGTKSNLIFADTNTIHNNYDLIIMNIDMHIAIEYFIEIEKHLNKGGKAIITFGDRFNLENELHRANSKLKIISENDLPNYKTFVLEVDDNEIL